MRGRQRYDIAAARTLAADGAVARGRGVYAIMIGGSSSDIALNSQLTLGSMLTAKP
jgi:hypothetical protein